MSPKVSVTIPVYNAEKFIKETIESVLEQTYSDFEIIVVDDGSTDKSAEIIKSFGDKRIIYIYQENQGVSVARNRGISKSKGEYIALLDHDDIWFREKLEKQIPVLDADFEIGLVYSDCYYFDIKRKTMKRAFRRAEPFRGAVFPQLFLSNFIPCLTAVIRKENLKQIGLFSPDLYSVEEYDLFLRIAKCFMIEYIDLPLGEYRIHETNLSKNSILCCQETIEVLDKFLGKNPEITEILGEKVNSRLYQAHFSLGRAYQFQRSFAEARREFIISAKYCPSGIKPHIGYLSSLLKVVIPSREKTVGRLLP